MGRPTGRDRAESPSPRSGPLLEGLRPRWHADALEQDLRRLWPALRLEIAGSLPSTNTALMERMRGELAAASARPPLAPCLLVAQQQTQGRGRMGRAWLSSPGRSLTFSLAFESRRDDLAGLSLAVGVALAEALEPSPDRAERAPRSPGMPEAGTGGSPAQRLRLKWPNDLCLLAGPGPESARKLGGILIESLGMGSRRICVVGVGLNVQRLPPPADAEAGLPATAALSDLVDTAHVPGLADERADAQADERADEQAFAQAFAQAGEAVHAAADPSPQGALARVAPALLRAVDRFMEHGFAAFAADYSGRDLLAGLQVAGSGAVRVQGRAEGVDADGALLVRDARGVLHPLRSGEISVRVHPAGQPVEAVAC